MPITGKQVKIFRKRTDDEPYVTLERTDSKEKLDKDHGGAGREESGFEFIIDIRGESNRLATDEGIRVC